MKCVVVIPARYKSTRFPGKPLVDILGAPMIIRVAEQSEKAVGKENVYIATDSLEISEVVEKAGFRVVMTSSEALTGTDRIAEAVKSIDADIFINVQGDEPIINPEDIVRVCNKKLECFDSVVNGYTYLSDGENSESVNIPKVITAENDMLVYMSRLPIPGVKEVGTKEVKYKKQVCIYGFNRDELEKYASFGRKSHLESYEDIEILRFFELGIPVSMVETTGGTIAVDVVDDVRNVEDAINSGAITWI